MALFFCPLYSGSGGNSSYAQSENTRILVDAGLAGRAICGAIEHIGANPRELDAIFITHEHSDHICGAGIISRKFDIPVYATEKTWLYMEDKLGSISTANKRIIGINERVDIKDMSVSAFSIPHDAVQPVGYCVTSGYDKVSIATDLGCIKETWMSAVKDSDLLLLESNHDMEMLRTGRYPAALKKRISGKRGHLSNDDCGRAVEELIDAGIKHIILGHLSQENNLPELAYATVAEVITKKGAVLNKDIKLDMAWRDKIGKVYKIGE